MEEAINSLITVMEIAIGDNKFERKDLLEQYIKIPNLLYKTFNGNPNLESAISYFQNIVMSYINESEMEYQFFDKALKYLYFILNNIEMVDESILSEINAAIDEIEVFFASRTISLAEIVTYYSLLIANDILTDKNYYIVNLADRYSEDKKRELLSIIPDK